MKRFLLFSIALILFGCDGCDNDPKPKTELEKLPAITQQGKNTFGCLVNGKAWVPKTSIDANAVYQSGALQISGDLSEKNRDQNIQLIILYGVAVNVPFDLTIVPQYQGKFVWVRPPGICFYEEENTLSGQLTITKLYAPSRVVSGTFEFVTVVSGCDTVRVTDGRFDLTYAD